MSEVETIDKSRENSHVESKASSFNTINNNVYEKGEGDTRPSSSRSWNRFDVSDDHPGRRNPPPDGGWGWVIVFASFMISLISDGISLSTGTIFVELSDYFEESKSKTSWVLSIILSMPLLAGPIASYLTDRYGCRTMCISGAFLASMGFIISFMANSLEVLYLTFTISGFGLALCLVTSVVIIPYYFEKKRGLATGLSVCGTGIGTFLFPPLVSYLLDNYGWRGTFLILAGFFLNIVVFGLLMRDLEFTDKSDGSESSFENGQDGLSRKDANEDEFSTGVNPRLCSSLLQLPTFLPKEFLSGALCEEMNKEGQIPLFVNQCMEDDGKCGLMTKAPSLVVSPVNTLVQVSDLSTVAVSTTIYPKAKRKSSIQCRQPGVGWLSKGLGHNSEYLKKLRLQRGSLTYRGAMLNIPRYKLRTSSCPDIYRNSATTISETNKTCQLGHDLKEVLLDMIDLRIFANIRFSFFCISNFILYACVDVPYVYLQDYAITKGLDREPASFLISILGILNTLGMVMVGYFGDKDYVDSALLYMLFVVVCGFSMAVFPWLMGYTLMSVAAALYGFTISANYTLMSVIVVNLISLDNFTSAYGMLLLIQGIASLIGPPVAGALYDLYGTYDITFLSTGLSIVTSGILVFPVVKSFAPFVSCSVSDKKESDMVERELGDRVNEKQESDEVKQKLDEMQELDKLRQKLDEQLDDLENSDDRPSSRHGVRFHPVNNVL